MRRNGASILLRALGRYGSGDGRNAAALREACGALRAVTIGDDRRQDFSGYNDTSSNSVGVARSIITLNLFKTRFDFYTLISI